MEIVFRATVIFFFLWGLTRAMGKRELAEMTAFELVLLITFGDLIQQAVTQEDMSVTGGILAVGTIGLWIVLFSAVGFRWPRARLVLEGVPVVVVKEGRPVMEALRLERLPLADLLESARKSGIEDLAAIKLGVLEPDGRFSFIKYESGADDGGEPEEKHRA
jgi:uncharacterized membrane protein YcaP (DUF421 family)